MNMAEVKVEDIPRVNFGKFVIDKLRKYGDRVALVSYCDLYIPCNDATVVLKDCLSSL